MTEVEQLVAQGLAGHQVERIPDGYRVAFRRGATELVFRPSTTGGADGDLRRIASVETRFAPGTLHAFDDDAIARYNRRAAFGALFRDEKGPGVRLTFSIYGREPAARWVAILLLHAFGHQFPYWIAALDAELSDEDFRSNRANLEYPRDWAPAIDPGAFSGIAGMFAARGLVSLPGRDGITLEVPLGPGGATRLSDGRAETALIRVSTGVRHPLAGVGYFASLALPVDPAPRWVAGWSSCLNAAEHEQQDFVPRWGAWAARRLGGQLVHNLFLPWSQGDAMTVGTIANWMVQRAAWIRSQWWTPGKGLGSPVEFAR